MGLISKARLEKIKNGANELLTRTIDQHVTLAVTGLSRSGKTAFITSLVNQLINESNNEQLTFFNVAHQARFIAAKRVPQKHFHISRFDYESAVDALSTEPPQWPSPTKGISELRLAIKYQPKNSLLKYATDSATLYLDITDYPGEWLLDLPMLNQTFEEWSVQMCDLLKQSPRFEISQEFLAKVAQLDAFSPTNEELLAEISAEYTSLLHKFRFEHGLSLIQPGRFILPGELIDAPILQFFPYTEFENLDANTYQNAGDDTLIGMLRARFIEYKERVVRKFYREHFIKFDRQIVLADCLTPLNNGPDSFNDLQQAINLILENFDYGKSSLFTRLFSPKIDKLLFAATKADHITPDQQGNLVSLLEKLVYQTRQELRYDGIKVKALALSSIKTTKTGKAVQQGKEVPVIKGLNLATRKLTTLFPGGVPSDIPDKDYWQRAGFNFVSFAPVNPVALHESIPHIRMDQALEFLLGDKLK